MFLDTAMMSNPSPEVRAKIPIGRLGKPDEIASIVFMLVQNGYMTNKVSSLSCNRLSWQSVTSS